MLKQHYYTAYNDPELQAEGFRTKAASPGVTQELVTLLMPNIRFVNMSHDQQNGSQPEQIGYRYQHIEKDQYALIHTVASSEGGRRGNFFAHSLIGSQSAFSNVNPTCFYAHSMWVRNDPSMRKDLPLFDISTQRPTLSIQHIWGLLDNPQQRTWLAGLISAIVNMHENGGRRRIIILDHSANVALWIAAVSLALPAKLRTRLTFSTYDNDMKATNGHITGLLSQSITLKESDFADFFILDPARNRISTTQASKYADFVASRMTPERYRELEDFFQFLDRRIGDSSDLSIDWEGLTDTFILLGTRQISQFTTEQYDLMRSFVRNVGSDSQPDPQDLDLIDNVKHVFRNEMMASGKPETVTDYQNVAALSARYRRPDPESLYKDLEFLTTHLGSSRLAQALVPAVINIYGKPMVADAVKQESFLRLMNSKLTSIDSATSIWWALEQMVGPNDIPPTLLDSTLALITSTGGDSQVPPKESESLLSTLSAFFRNREVALFHALAPITSEREAYARHWLYYQMVADRPLAERAPIRTAGQLNAPGFLSLEYRRDIGRVSPKQALGTLDNWIANVSTTQEWIKQNTELTAKRILSNPDPDESASLCQQLLRQDHHLENLDDTSIQMLIQNAFENLDPSAPLMDDSLPFIEMYERHPLTLPETKNVLRVALDFSRGVLSPSTISYTRRQLGKLNESAYQQELHRMLGPVFTVDASIEEYEKQILTSYVPHYLDQFWFVHDQLLVDALASAPQSKNLLSRFQKPRQDNGEIERKATWFSHVVQFWYERAPERFLAKDFAVQGYFSHLPGVLTQLQSGAEWNAFLVGLENLCEQEPWGQALTDVIRQVEQGSDASRSR